MKKYDLNILSLGAGVQSSTLLLMLQDKYLDYPVDAAVFSDTGGEPDGVYEHLSWLENNLDIPIYKVKGGNLENDLTNGKFINAPFYTYNIKGEISILKRQCTDHYKIRPFYNQIRKMLGLKKHQRSNKTVRVYMGISYDEITRMKPSKTKWITNEYPLVRNRITRGDCINWLQQKGYPVPPKSACYFCPFISNNRWLEIKETDPELFNKAVKMDKEIRNARKGFNLYLHQERKPLNEIDFKKLINSDQLDLFNECSGHCGI